MERSVQRSNPGILIIGYGSPLRGDDAAGQHAVADWVDSPPSGCEVRCLHQLTPDLAGDVARATLVIFIDAVPARPEANDLQVSRITADRGDFVETATHHASPSSLLALARRLYGVLPKAWLIGIPASDFSLGDTLTPATAAGVRAAREIAAEIIAAFRRDTGVPVHA